MKASVNYVGSSDDMYIRVESENIQTGAKKHCNSLFYHGIKDAQGKKCASSRLIFLLKSK
jgi:hypothetical protein